MKSILKDIQGVWEDHLHTAIFKIDNQQRPNVWEKK